MDPKTMLSADVAGLRRRVQPDGSVAAGPGGASSTEAAALALPTLAERNLLGDARRVARHLLESRDPEGGWDDPWTTLLGLEACIALVLRGIGGSEEREAVRHALRVVRGLDPLDPAERELRLARDIVLAGIALQQPGEVDAGLLRARGVVDSGLSWSPAMDDGLHGLLALTDLFRITSDAATRELIDHRVQELNLADPASWAEGEAVGVVSRAGTVLEKLGHVDAARDALALALERGSGDDLSTSDLKHRIELAARLVGDQVKHEAEGPAGEAPGSGAEAGSGAGAAEEERDGEQPSEQGIVDIEALPAFRTRRRRPEGVTAVVVQEGDVEGVADTVRDLLMQERPPEEMVVVWAGEGRDLKIPEYLGSLTQVHAGAGDRRSRRWRMGIAAARHGWLWMLRSGTRAEPGALAAMMNEASEAVEAVHLSTVQGEVDRILGTIRVEPSLQSERVLARCETVQTLHGRASELEDVVWELGVSSLAELRWAEAVERENIRVEPREPTLEELATRVEDASRLRRLYPSEGPEERQARRKALEKLRQTSYSVHHERGLPLATIILDDAEGTEYLEQSLRSVIENTQLIPFEVIVVAGPALDEKEVRALESLGVLVMRREQDQTRSRMRNRAAESAQGRCLAFLSGGAEVEEHWLVRLVGALEEEPDVGIVGGQVLGDDGRLAHVGVVFHGEGLPTAIHAGAPVTAGHVHKRRPYQAVAGGMLVVRRSVLEAVSGFREPFSGPWAEVDLCLRAREQGTGILYEPSARCRVGAPAEDFFRKDEAAARQWLSFWQQRVQSDLEGYAHLDGYRVEWVNGWPKLSPMGEKMNVLHPANHEEATTDAPPAPVLAGDQAFLQLLARADTLIKDGEFDTAEQTLMDARSNLNGNVDVRVRYWTLLGDARFRLDRPDEAFACYRKAVEDDPSAERAWIGIATYHLIKGDLEQADDIFGRVLKLNPANMRGHLGQGNVELQRGKPAEALPRFVEAAKLEPGHRPTIVGLVAAAVQSEKMGEAKGPLERYLKVRPDDAEARFHLAAVLYGGNELSRAREEAELVLRARPSHEGARQLLEHLGESSGAQG